MPIRREDPGLASLYGRAAVLAGRATAAREQAQTTMRQYDRGQQVQLAMLRMSHDKEMERFRADMDLMTRKRAQMFRLEQIETNARINAAREQRDEQQLMDEIKQGIKAINEYPYYDEEEKAEAALNYRLKKLGGYVRPEQLSTREREMQLMEQLIGTPTAEAGAEVEAPTGVPTADELRRQSTREAYQMGISLGYWK